MRKIMCLSALTLAGVMTIGMQGALADDNLEVRNTVYIQYSNEMIKKCTDKLTIQAQDATKYGCWRLSSGKELECAKEYEQIETSTGKSSFQCLGQRDSSICNITSQIALGSECGYAEFSQNWPNNLAIAGGEAQGVCVYFRADDKDTILLGKDTQNVTPVPKKVTFLYGTWDEGTSKCANPQ